MAAKSKTGTEKVNPSAAPGTDDEAGKKTGSKRVDHPLIGSNDTEVYPFKSLPSDFEFPKHRPLKKKDFALEHAYFDYRARQCEFGASFFRKREDEAKTLGSSKERAKARRLVKMQEKIAELRTQLESQGVDVDKLLASQS